MESIKEAVENIMQGLEARKKSPAADSPGGLLKKILTKKELKHIKFTYFRKGTVNINVDSSSWLYQLNLQKAALLAKLTQKSGTIKDIRFHLGELK